MKHIKVWLMEMACAREKQTLVQTNTSNLLYCHNYQLFFNTPSALIYDAFLWYNFVILKAKMKTKINIYMALVTAFAVILANTAMVFADEQTVAGSSSSGSGKVLSDTEQKQQEFLNKLNDELDMTKADYRQVLNNISTTDRGLKNVSEDQMTLQDQLDNLDSMVNQSKNRLNDVLLKIAQTENRITYIYDQIELKKIQIESQRNLLKEYITMIYKAQNEYVTLDEKGQLDAFKLLLSDESVDENLRKLKYFDLLNETGQQMIDGLDASVKELHDYKDELKVRNEKLKEFEDGIAKEKEALVLQKEAKETLLRITNGQESIYAKLFEQSLKEKDLVLSDLKNLANAITFVENKIREQGDNFNPDEYMELLDSRTQALYEFRMRGEELGQFIWPVIPRQGISAYFHDPNYGFGMVHNAVDIPTYQGTDVQAVADGVVYSAKDNDYGYSYIILAHADGVMTVYGHISKIMVKEGHVVKQGEAIAASGGMPGTKGAGYMTTGPHLHFEVMVNGRYVDPINFLSLSVMSKSLVEETLPEKYWNKWEDDVINSAENAINKRSDSSVE